MGGCGGEHQIVRSSDHFHRFASKENENNSQHRSDRTLLPVTVGKNDELTTGVVESLVNQQVVLALLSMASGIVDRRDEAVDENTSLILVDSPGRLRNRAPTDRLLVRLCDRLDSQLSRFRAV